MIQGKSNSFSQITPFRPRTSLLADSYIAFPVDIDGSPTPPCSPDFTFECRTKSGTASLIGFSEVSGFSSTPPKKFRTVSGAGIINRCVFSSPGCSSLLGSDSNEFSGSRTYNISTGIVSGSGEINVNRDSGFCPATTHLSTSNLEIAWPLSISGGDLDGFSLSSSARTQTITGLGVCFVASDANIANATGSLTLTITAEDTEANAITRFNDATEWGEWSPGSQCRASYQQRTTGFSFEITDAQFRVTGVGIFPGAVMTAKIPIFRSVYGMEDFSLLTTITAYGFADGSGVAVITGDVPNSPGFDTYAGTPIVTAQACQQS